MRIRKRDDFQHTLDFMTLAECKEQIEKHRAEAKKLRRKADAQDAMADALRREAAKLDTPLLEPIANPLKEGQTAPRFTGRNVYEDP